MRSFPAWEERVPRSNGLVYASPVSSWSSGISCWLRLAVGTEFDIILVAIVRNRNHHDQAWLTASGRGLGEGLATTAVTVCRLGRKQYQPIP